MGPGSLFLSVGPLFFTWCRRLFVLDGLRLLGRVRSDVVHRVMVINVGSLQRRDLPLGILGLLYTIGLRGGRVNMQLYTRLAPHLIMVVVLDRRRLADLRDVLIVRFRHASSERIVDYHVTGFRLSGPGGQVVCCACRLQTSSLVSRQSALNLGEASSVNFSGGLVNGTL